MYWAKPAIPITQTSGAISLAHQNYYVGFSLTNRLFASFANSTGDQKTRIFGNHNDVTVGEWQHCAYVLSVDSDDNVTQSVYVNGELIETYIVEGEGASDVYGSYFAVGTFSTSALGFEGDMDEIMMFNKALSADKIKEIYNEQNNDNLVGYWKLDGNVNDSSSSDYNGIVYGSEITNKGKFGQAYEFNGDADFIQISQALTAVNHTNRGGNWTMSAWANFKDCSQKSGILGTNYNVINLIWLGTTNAAPCKLYSLVRGGSGVSGYTTPTITGTTTINTNEWYLTTLVSNTTHELLYLNGQLEGTAEQQISSGNNSVFQIGTYSSNNFNGTIDEVKIFNKALSQSEILELYTSSPYTSIMNFYGTPAES